jgi:hypothetical protein
MQVMTQARDIQIGYFSVRRFPSRQDFQRGGSRKTLPEKMQAMLEGDSDSDGGALFDEQFIVLPQGF